MKKGNIVHNLQQKTSQPPTNPLTPPIPLHLRSLPLPLQGAQIPLLTPKLPTLIYLPLRRRTLPIRRTHTLTPLLHTLPILHLVLLKPHRPHRLDLLQPRPHHRHDLRHVLGAEEVHHAALMPEREVLALDDHRVGVSASC